MRIALTIVALVAAFVSTVSLRADPGSRQSVSAEALKSRAIERLDALAAQLDRETKQASSEFSKLSRPYPFAEYSMAVNRTIADLNASDSALVRNVMARAEVQQITQDIERNSDFVAKDPTLVRGKLFGTVSEEVGTYKADIAHLRALIDNIKAAPADQIVGILGSAYLSPKTAALISPTTSGDLGALAFYATGSGRVVGRANPTIDFPAVAQVMQDYGDGTMVTSCTGTLVAPNAVLSAAHCFCKFDETQKYLDTAKACRAAKFVRIDGSKVDALGTSYRRIYFQHAGPRRIAKIEIADELAFPKADLAMVFLADPITDIAPARIAEDASIRPGELGLIVGFGRHSRLDSAGRPLSLRAEDNEAGLKFAATTRVGTCSEADLDKKLVCWTYSPESSTAPADAGNTCNGDSGGPLFASRSGGYVIAGVTSGGVDRNCGPADYSFDVDVFSFRDWITRILAANPAATTTRSASPAPLTPTTNDYKLFPIWKNWSRFDYARPVWEREFQLQAGVERLRFGMNSHVLRAARPLKIQLRGPDGKLKCNVSSEENVLMCPRIDRPPAGRWKFSLEGPAGLDFQAVATGLVKGN